MNIEMELKNGAQISQDEEKMLNDIADEVLRRHEGYDPELTEVSLVLTDDNDIHELNLTYRGKNMPTDVLSFAMLEGEDMLQIEGVHMMLGDIVISMDRMESQAKEYGHSRERELGFLFVHGMLHLLGYDHIEENDRLEMEALQEDILNTLDIKR